MRALALGVIPLVSLATAASAQKWKDIGTTVSGNVVSVDPRSVKRNGTMVSATVRVVFTPPVKAARGTWASSKTIATFDCTRRYLAAKENVFYSDANSTKVIERNVNKLPGFGPALGGSLGSVAVDYLCGPKK
ncbi:MAG: surface-adhesin E family protein [Gemmatimonadaceae bacterium]